MAYDYIGQNIYNEIPAQKFILQCYGARSKLVHTGSVKNSDFDIGTLSACLDVYLSDLLSAIIESKGT